MALSREDRLRRAFEKPSPLSPAGHVRNERNDNGAGLREDVEARQFDQSRNPDTPGLDDSQIDPLWQPLTSWFDSRVWLDTRAIALRLPPRWTTSVEALWRDRCQWALDHDLVTVSRAEFQSLLSRLGCEMCRIAGQEFMAHLALKADVLDRELFQSPPVPPAPTRIKPHIAKPWRPK